VSNTPWGLTGSVPPLVTPFHPDGSIDLDTFRALVRSQVAGRSSGVVVTGTSGEPSVLTVDERTMLYAAAVEEAGGDLAVVAATGSQSLAETLALTRAAEAAGADAALVVTPYYIKPPQRGLVEYFATVAAATTLPVLIYHIPGRAAVGMSVKCVAEVVDRCPNVVGIKHASNDLEFVTDLLHELGRDFAVYAGLEQLSFPILALGGAGLMNAVGNLAPRALVELCEAVEEQRLAPALDLHMQLSELNKAVFWDTNPIPMKYLMWRRGLLPHDTHRLPMVPPGPELAARLDALLEQAVKSGVIAGTVAT
jgi:4-hydroxy-tetrahydrodipicolinate synthase